MEECKTVSNHVSSCELRKQLQLCVSPATELGHDTERAVTILEQSLVFQIHASVGLGESENVQQQQQHCDTVRCEAEGWGLRAGGGVAVPSRQVAGLRRGLQCAIHASVLRSLHWQRLARPWPPASSVGRCEQQGFLARARPRARRAAAAGGGRGAGGWRRAAWGVGGSPTPGKAQTLAALGPPAPSSSGSGSG